MVNRSKDENCRAEQKHVVYDTNKVMRLGELKHHVPVAYRLMECLLQQER